MTGRAAEPEVIWTRPERAGRGPKPAYGRSDIAAVAVRVADADGIDAVSMRRVAAELGLGTMSLYNYVPRKDDLYELMVDAVSAEYDLADPTGDWRADLLGVARQARALMIRHPWMPRLMSPVYGYSPNALRYLEYCMACLAPVDLPAGTKMELVASLTGVVTFYVANEISAAERTRSLPWSQEREFAMRTAYLVSRISTGEYPHLAAAFTQSAGPVDMEAAFERALARTLDGFVPS
ncbi:TetR family transcriptional regulator [Streptomyces sp. CB01635]|uniref:TetR/AcrR family transcriptional regulator n=1 Tax=unclassified Streptomyces TaxID=2593676 RepID=UPI000C28071C|nr:TetR/AcrR family transcriptional regulator C-terminal domain-containing protein [Streptomyces sp. CB01635]PJN06653.1 TetR family transcriptional regulator [Streptomyces sp. CB01635]